MKYNRIIAIQWNDRNTHKIRRLALDILEIQCKKLQLKKINKIENEN